MFGRVFTEVAPNIFMNTNICTCESSWLEWGHEINIAVIKSHKRSLAISVSRETKNKYQLLLLRTRVCLLLVGF